MAKDETKKQPNELTVIARIERTLKGLPNDAQFRVLNYVRDKLYASQPAKSEYPDVQAGATAGYTGVGSAKDPR